MRAKATASQAARRAATSLRGIAGLIGPGLFIYVLFEPALTTLNESFQSGLKSFAVWMAKDWKMPETEVEWKKQGSSDPWPCEEWVRAYNACVASVEGAPSRRDEPMRKMNDTTFRLPILCAEPTRKRARFCVAPPGKP